MNELETAADLIEGGWCKASLLDGDGKVCSAGAIYAAHKGYSVGMLKELSISEQIEFEMNAGRYVEDSDAGKALADEIRETESYYNVDYYRDSPYSTIWNYNDDVHRTQAEVLERFKYAAKRLD